MQQDDAQERRVWTVSELNGSARLALSSHFGTVWVEGEISNLATPSSGHLYFTLKDRDAQVRCAMFRGSARGLGTRLANGASVLVRAQVSLYEPRGDYQLVVDRLEELGDGALRRAFEALKRRLDAEGLFAHDKKRPLPSLPRRIGVITSPSGAAVHDILTVLRRRFPALPVILFPARVQGNEAAQDIARAIALADRSGLCDVLILARGGGSLEDLWPFNEEIVARAIFACRTPLVSGVGHEVDVTIADLVADLRAATPSAAAEAVSPERTEWLERVASLENRLLRQLRRGLQRQSDTLGFIHKRLRQAHPVRQIQRNAQRLDELELRLRRVQRTAERLRALRLEALVARLHRSHPGQRLPVLEDRIRGLRRSLASGMERRLEAARLASAKLCETLHAVSPLATLQRGYAIVTRQADGSILRDSAEIAEGELIEAKLARGTVVGKVIARRPPS
ncbi:exodeoxyribonuclease VII large subunit [Methyloterricola oryzae]|uniref:exodeoxyribonuclease VII large subunit n=1 Tax=Methyloterricola oryzae TaxID=1495050 RepID=UPI0005EB298A|nr:exodeoxyribonuclease VII large subunit [Methyloterricola oryzae]